MTVSSSGLHAQVAVVGSGPAGWAAAAALAEAGVETVLVAPAPDEVWPATYGCWVDELEPVGLRSVAGTAWPSVRVTGHRDHEVRRAYTILDNARLHGLLSSRFGRAGGRAVAGAAVGAQHFGWGSRLLLDDDPPMAVRLIVDATGGGRHGLLRPAGPPRAHQTAYGFVARFDRPPVPAGSCTLMDWSPAAPRRRPGRSPTDLPVRHGPGRRPRSWSRRPRSPRRRRWPTASCASGWPPASRAWEPRQPRSWVRSASTSRWAGRSRRCKRSWRPGPRPASCTQPPATPSPPGCGSRPGWPPPCVARSTPASSRTRWRPRRGRRCGHDPGGEPAASSRSGCRRLLGMGPDEVRSFFDAFFALPTERWAPYLSGSGSTVELARAMTAVFRASPGDVRRRLARG